MPIEIGDIKLYSISELSKKLNVTEVTLRSYCRTGKMKGKKMGTSWYITAEALREYFNGQPITENESIQGDAERKP